MPINTERLISAQRYIPNLRVVSENVVRGGRPEPEGLRALKDAGVRTIINLCGASSLLSLFKRSSSTAGVCESPEVSDEKQRAQQLGMQFVAIPLDVFAVPAESALDEFAGIVNDTARHPVFVHCQHGRDRTGLMTGVYRVLCGWTVQQAYEEMLECGFDGERTNLRDALFAFAQRHGAPRGG